MRIKKLDDGYMIWLSASDTYNWAHKIRANWPCSELSGKRFFAAVDSGGIYDFTLDGKMHNVNTPELMACISDHLPKDLKKYWPCWI